MSEITPGAVFQHDYPFILERAMVGFDEEGALYAKTWCPGVRFEPIGPEESGAFADGVGKQILTVVSVHKPRPFPERVFYTRKWLSPKGKSFGCGRLHIKTTQAFRRLISGYRYEYEVEQEAA